MKDYVTFSCGHTGEVQLFGSNKDRERKIKWYEESALCPECYKKQQEERGKELAAEYNLPEITGVSDKQIAFAETLRGRYLTSYSINELKKLSEIMHELRTEHRAELDAMLTKLGQTEDEFFAQRSHKMGLGKAYTVLTTGDARQLIDALNNY